MTSLKSMVKLVTWALVVWVIVMGEAAIGKDTEEIEHLKRGVVRILALTTEGLEVEGTGVIVRSKPGALYVVTAAHVIEGCREISVELYGLRGRLFPSRVLGLEGGDDLGLAALHVKVPTVASDVSVVLPLNRDPVERTGNPIMIVGFPRKIGVPWMVTRGELVGRKGRNLAFTASIEPGNSGGPLIQNGEVIGIVAGTRGAASFATPASIIRYALEGWGVSFGVQLRSKPASLTAAYLVKMVQDLGFSHPFDLSAEGLSGSSFRRFEHDYESQTLSGVRVVVDHATDLMWQQDGSKQAMKRNKVDEYIAGLNRDGLAGFSDWRLPTAEELASLLEPVGLNDRLYVDPIFVPLIRCWSADDITRPDKNRGKTTYYFDQPVYVDFSGGCIDSTQVSGNFVRVIRSLESRQGKQAPATAD